MTSSASASYVVTTRALSSAIALMSSGVTYARWRMNACARAASARRQRRARRGAVLDQRRELREPVVARLCASPARCERCSRARDRRCRRVGSRGARLDDLRRPSRPVTSIAGSAGHAIEHRRARRRRDVDQQHEPVELRLGQRVRALLLDRVLRREHEERIRQRMRLSPIVTCRSCIASSSADCTFAGARLISSASTRFANSGPTLLRELPGVHVVDDGAGDVGRQQIRRELDARERRMLAICDGERTVSVFARPGTPSSRQWPPVSRPISTRSIMYSCPTTRSATCPVMVLDQARIPRSTTLEWRPCGISESVER